MSETEEDYLLTVNELLQTLEISKEKTLVATQYNQGFMTTKLDYFSKALYGDR